MLPKTGPKPVCDEDSPRKSYSRKQGHYSHCFSGRNGIHWFTFGVTPLIVEVTTVLSFARTLNDPILKNSSFSLFCSRAYQSMTFKKMFFIERCYFLFEDKGPLWRTSDFKTRRKKKKNLSVYARLCEIQNWIFLVVLTFRWFHHEKERKKMNTSVCPDFYFTDICCIYLNSGQENVKCLENCLETEKPEASELRIDLLSPHHKHTSRSDITTQDY